MRVERGARSDSLAIRRKRNDTASRTGEHLKILRITLVVLALALSGCLPRVPDDPSLLVVDRGKLPPPDMTLNIPGLSPCTDNADRTLHLNSSQPVTVLVHGCYGSAGLFRALGQVLAFHGQQAVCFSYDYRDSLMTSSSELIASLEALARGMRNKRITVIGHSQGGLIARKALVAERLDALADTDAELRLVTVSAPLAGIASAETCGSAQARYWSLGIIPVLCRIVSGEKWYEITSASDFIRRPGELVGPVGEYLKIVTDERGACREYDKNGACVEEDFVFSLAEQRIPAIDQGGRVKNVEVRAGHVEIVGDRRVVPEKLIAVLQRNGILNPTEPGRAEAFKRLLARLYLEEPELDAGPASCRSCAGRR